MRKARYIRVSTGNQKTARQEARQNKDEIIFTDIVSGSIPFEDREKGKDLMKAIQSGEIDYVSVSSIDRLGRNLYNILTTLEFFKENGIILKVDSRSLTKPTI